ncbi:MAG TPA: DUF4388 domain-containing protein [Acidimicrobiales bacterium]
MAEATMPTEGSSDSLSVGAVLQSLADERRTGLLRLHGAEPHIVALADGRVYLATSASGASIHQIVVGSGAAPEAAWADAGLTGDEVAAALDEDERVDSDRLRTVLREHVVATVAELLAPGTERYEFLADQVHQLGPRFCFPVDQVLADAEQRLATWRSINTTLPSTGTRIRRSPTLPQDSVSESLSAVEWQVVSAMPTEGTVAEVIAVSGLSAFTVFDVLHRLVRRGLVQPLGEDAATP